MATAIPLHQITAADWQPKLGELGSVVEGLDDIDQCVRIILSTPRGSVPHRPDFGSDLWQYLDWPTTAARPHLVREAVEAIARWEPRAKVRRVEVRPADEIDPARVSLLVEWSYAGASRGTLLELRP